MAKLILNELNLMSILFCNMFIVYIIIKVKKWKIVNLTINLI